MPLYEYRCHQCGRVFEQLRSIERADDDSLCPACGSEDIERLLSTIASKVRACSSGPGRAFR